MTAEGVVYLTTPDGDCRSLGHVEDAGDYDAPPELWSEWASLRNEWWLARQSARAEGAERESTYRTQQGY